MPGISQIKDISLMIRRLFKPIGLFLFALAFCTCVDPYYPDLKGYESLLVVRALITDEAVPYEVRLSRSFQNADSIPDKIKDATVYVSDEAGKITSFQNCGNGTYVTQPETFRGETGKTYTLHISTADGKEYISDPATMLPVPGIDSLYYEKDIDFSGANNEIMQGIRFYVDTDKNQGETRYLRWEYEETWKFRLSDYQRYDYYADTLILPRTITIENCWKTAKSTDIMIASIPDPGEASLKRAPICFVASAGSDRLLVQYSILAKQYSISGEAYEYLNDLMLLDEAGGTIFDKQPFPVISNIKNLNDPGEKVLGFFQVSAVTKKRISVTANVMNELDLPYYHYNCTRYEVNPLDFHVEGSMAPVMTWDELYNMFVGADQYMFIEPIYDPKTHQLIDLAFTERECSDCELTGSSLKPEWWIDLI